MLIGANRYLLKIKFKNKERHQDDRVGKQQSVDIQMLEYTNMRKERRRREVRSPGPSKNLKCELKLIGRVKR